MRKIGTKIGTAPVKYLQNGKEKVLVMFADCNKFGDFTRLLAGRIKFEMSWQVELLSFFFSLKKKKRIKRKALLKLALVSANCTEQLYCTERRN